MEAGYPVDAVEGWQSGTRDGSNRGHKKTGHKGRFCFF
jgi:hypothetical protein